MTYEAFAVEFLIPSQVTNTVRSAQVMIQQSLLKYAFPSKYSLNDRNGNNCSSNDDKGKYLKSKKNDRSGSDNKKSFSASSYIFVSSILAKELKYLPEAEFILTYTDPLPHMKIQNYSFTSKLGGSGNVASLQSRVNRHASGTVVSWSLLPILLYIGQFPLELQRCFVTVPLPVICSAITSLVLALYNVPYLLFILLSIIFFILLGTFCYYYFDAITELLIQL